MKFKEKEDEEITNWHNKIFDTYGKKAFLGVFSTLLGASDKFCRYLTNLDPNKMDHLPYSVQYACLHTAQIISTCGGIIQNKVKKKDIKIGGYFPGEKEGIKWDSEEAFEQKLILFVETLYNHLKAEGKIK
jgi:hypothetical protein